MKELFDGKPIEIIGEIKGISMSEVQFIDFLNNIRINPNILVRYDRDEENWKRVQEKVEFIRKKYEGYDDVVAFDPYRGEKLAETVTVISNDNYQKSREADLAVSELKEMFKDNDKVVVFDSSRRRK